MVGTKIHFTAGTTLHPAVFGQIAQLVEQGTENSPCRWFNSNSDHLWEVAQLVEHLDSGPEG